MSFIKDCFRKILYKNLSHQINSLGAVCIQKSPEYIEWLDTAIIEFTNDFCDKRNLCSSPFIKMMNAAFNTDRFDILLKKYTSEYLGVLFNIVHDLPDSVEDGRFFLEDNPLNRGAIEVYEKRFGIKSGIIWRGQPALISRSINIIFRVLAVIYRSLRDGVVIGTKLKKHRVMREALWGLYEYGGFYFHDDFMVDGDRIKKDDLLLFSRGLPTDNLGKRIYDDAKNSPYGHFTLGELPIGIRQFFLRIIPKYVCCGSVALFRSAPSEDFSLFYSVYLFFTSLAVPYEKVFSNYKLDAELGQDYHSARHVPESIVCQNYGVRYYLFHWSDISMKIGSFLPSFLSCDKYLIWGIAHMRGSCKNNSIFMPTGYIFKKFIKDVIANRHDVLSGMGIEAKGTNKVISFFDESFGGEVSHASNSKLTAEHFINFWAAALETARTYSDSIVIIKPKEMDTLQLIPEEFKGRFLSIKKDVERLSNAYILDKGKWSFIEVIGVSDIVITQGMTSSATIALICGIDGLYLDEAIFDHHFRRYFKNTAVFDDSEKLLEKIGQIIKGKASVVAGIPQEVMRDFDAYDDARGIDRVRDVLIRG